MNALPQTCARTLCIYNGKDALPPMDVNKEMTCLMYWDRCDILAEEKCVFIRYIQPSQIVDRTKFYAQIIKESKLLEVTFKDRAIFSIKTHLEHVNILKDEYKIIVIENKETLLPIVFMPTLKAWDVLEKNRFRAFFASSLLNAQLVPIRSDI